MLKNKIERVQLSHMFKPTNQQFNQYIKATQCSTVRLDNTVTAKNIAGLCTDGMSACIAVIIVSADKQRISLSHTDLLVENEAILSECQWAGQLSQIIIVRGFDYVSAEKEQRYDLRTKTLPRIEKFLQENQMLYSLTVHDQVAVNGAVAVKRDAEIIFPVSSGEKLCRIGKIPPDASYKHAVAMINAYALRSQYRYHPLFLQYDGVGWSKKPALTMLGIKFIKNIDYTNIEVGQFKEIYDFENEPIVTFSQDVAKEAAAAYKQGEYGVAIKKYLAAISYFTKVDIDDHFYLGIYYCNLGCAYRKNDEIDRAQECFSRSLAISKNIGAEDEQFAKTSAEFLTDILANSKQFQH